MTDWVTFGFSLLTFAFMVGAKYFGDIRVRRAEQLALERWNELVGEREARREAQNEHARLLARQPPVFAGFDPAAPGTGWTMRWNAVGDPTVEIVVNGETLPIGYGSVDDDPRDVRCAGSRLDGSPCKNLARRGREKCRRCESQVDKPYRALRVRDEL